MSDEKLLLFNDIYNRTLHFGRTQFVREIMKLQQENQSLKKENKILRENAENNDKVVDEVNWKNQELNKQLEEYKLITIDYQDLEARNQELKERINKAIEYIRSNDIEVLKYYDIPSETTSYEIVTVDLLKILKGGESNE